ncbi:MAG: TSUP family transporter [Rubripirellula sp.]|nr:TSUP family transporter [Rubripirellula sp.]
MEYLESLLPLMLILCAGIFVQAATGFAGGLMIVPSMLYCGYSIPEAQCSLLVATIPQNAWGLWSLRDSITVRQVAWPGLGRLVLFPVGVLALQQMEALHPATIRQIVGGVVLLVTLAIISFRPRPQEKLHPLWAWIAFPASGFFQGLVGMGGPAMVFWVQAHDWGTKQTRAFMFAMYFISIAPGIAILYWFFGDRIIAPGLLAAVLIPLLLAVTVVGLRVGTRLGRTRLRRVSLGLLLLIGVAGLAAPWLR